MGALTTVRSWIARDAGSGTPTLRLSWPTDWFQRGMDAPPPRQGHPLAFPAVFASIDIISSDIARLPLKHWRDDGSRRTEVRPSQPVRVLDHPNEFQTGFDLMKALVASQLYRGNGYLFPRRNGRNEIDELHCLYPDNVTVYRSGADVFYRVSNGESVDLEHGIMIPAREMFHHRMLVFNDPLIGVTPMLAAATSTSAGLSILRSSEKFFQKMSRPSGVLQTASKIDRDVAERIRERWRRTYIGEEGAGEVAVLEQGLEWKPLTMTAVDAQLIEQLRYSVEDIARVFRLPLFMLGDLTKVSYNSSEQLTRIYWAGCLSAHIHSLEARMCEFFDMDGRTEYLEFDLDALFRTEMQARIDALTKAVQGGIRTPNEARRQDGLNPVEGGDTVFMQQQMVPVTALATRTDLAPKPAAIPAPAPPAREWLDTVQEEIASRIAATPTLNTDTLSAALMEAVFDPAQPRRAPRPRPTRQIIYGRQSRRFG